MAFVPQAAFTIDHKLVTATHGDLIAVASTMLGKSVRVLGGWQGSVLVECDEQVFSIFNERYFCSECGPSLCETLSLIGASENSDGQIELRSFEVSNTALGVPKVEQISGAILRVINDHTTWVFNKTAVVEQQSV